MSTVVAPFFRHRRRSVAFSQEPPANPPSPIEMPASVACALALAHLIDRDIDRGNLPDQSALAEALGFTRPRLTQLLQLAQLAPDIQDRVIGLRASDGLEPLSERALRHVAAALSWGEQRERFAKVSARKPRAPAR